MAVPAKASDRRVSSQQRKWQQLHFVGSKGSLTHASSARILSIDERVRGIWCQWYRLGPEQANTMENIHPSRVQPHSRFILMIRLLSCRGGA
jgi:hypothetical protein